MTTPVPEPTVPFLRWLGGKRWLAPSLVPSIRAALAGGGTYYEPFLGAGALALALAPGRAVLSDLNRDLMDCFRQVRDNPDTVLDLIAKWPVDRETYNEVRRSTGLTGPEAAARLIFLNRTCYGGLHRINKLGHFTSSFGGGSRTTASLFAENLIGRAAAVLARPAVHMCTRGYEFAFREAIAGDVIYCDPPYSVKSRETFDRYGADVFSWKDQENLASMARKACADGVLVLVSNTSHPEVATLYADASAIRFWKRKRVGNRANNDGTHDEMVFVLDPHARRSLWSSLQKKAGESYGPRLIKFTGQLPPGTSPVATIESLD